LYLLQILVLLTVIVYGAPVCVHLLGYYWQIGYCTDLFSIYHLSQSELGHKIIVLFLILYKVGEPITYCWAPFIGRTS